MIILLSAVFLLYFIGLLVVLIGYHRAMRSAPLPEESTQFISVIVPVRNELLNLKQVVFGLQQQSLPIHRFEVIFIDDHSTDGSAEWLRNVSEEKPNFFLLELTDGQGKKKALAKGIASARGSIIVTTDADCCHPPNWLRCMVQAFGETTNMIIGPVRVQENGTLFSKLQSLEFSSLVATAAATAGLGRPILCNGANLAFRKTVFYRVNGYEGNEQIPSGDDEFLMRKIEGSFPRTVRFLNNADGIVDTSPQETVDTFFHQRVRWAGKWKFNNSFTQATAMAVLLAQMGFLLAVALLALRQMPTWPMIGLLVVKLFMEALILIKVSTFLESKWRWGHFLLMQFIYPVYVIGVGFGSLWGKYEWKGRSLTHSMQRNP